MLANGATPVVAPETNLRTDIGEIVARVTERTKVVFLANPNNPTGTYVSIDEVRSLRAQLPSNVLLVLDAAYAEYVRRNDYEAGIELVATTQNTVMTRTFSKIHGLAGLRLGWAYCPEAVADVLNRIRGPFNVSVPAMAAGAAAIADKAHEDASAVHNERWLPWLVSEIEKLGLKVTPSVANFILVHFGKDGANGCRGGRQVPQAARHHRAQGRCLRPAGLPAHDHRHRGGQPRGRFGARRLPRGAAGMSQADVRARGADRHRPDRLVDQPRACAARVSPKRSSAAHAPSRRSIRR